MRKVTESVSNHCDRCNAELPAEYSGHGTHFTVSKIGHHESGHNGDQYTSTDQSMELCSKCGELVFDFIRSPVAHQFDAGGTKIIVLKPERGY